jgi:mercuric ion transport protein
MPTTPGVELIYFTGCPYVNAAREALCTALSAAGLPLVWQEWDQTAPAVPAHVQGFGSPTVLIDGRDVTGVGAATSAGPACCAGGAPGSEIILAVLASALADAI